MSNKAQSPPFTNMKVCLNNTAIMADFKRNINFYDPLKHHNLFIMSVIYITKKTNHSVHENTNLYLVDSYINAMYAVM